MLPALEVDCQPFLCVFDPLVLVQKPTCFNVWSVEGTHGKVCLKALFCCGCTRVHTFLEIIYEHFRIAFLTWLYFHSHRHDNARSGIQCVLELFLCENRVMLKF